MRLRALSEVKNLLRHDESLKLEYMSQPNYSSRVAWLHEHMPSTHKYFNLVCKKLNKRKWLRKHHSDIVEYMQDYENYEPYTSFTARDVVAVLLDMRLINHLHDVETKLGALNSFANSYYSSLNEYQHLVINQNEDRLRQRAEKEIRDRKIREQSAALKARRGKMMELAKERWVSLPDEDKERFRNAENKKLRAAVIGDIEDCSGSELVSLIEIQYFPSARDDRSVAHTETIAKQREAAAIQDSSSYSVSTPTFSTSSDSGFSCSDGGGGGCD